MQKHYTKFSPKCSGSSSKLKKIVSKFFLFPFKFSKYFFNTYPSSYTLYTYLFHRYFPELFTNFRIIKSRPSRNHRWFFWKNVKKNLIKFYKKIEEQSQKLWIDCENVEMWWNCNENLWKVYKKEKIFWKIWVNYT